MIDHFDKNVVGEFPQSDPRFSGLSYWAPGMTLQEVKIRVVRDALIYFDGNKTETAKALGISVRGLRNLVAENDKLKDYYVAPNWVPDPI
jgi:DNA-binding NtrC family response regulator